MNDRDENPEYHPLVLSYKAENGREVPLSIKAKTRGNFCRTLRDCTYTPLLRQFSRDDALLSSIFSEQNKLKLVVPCLSDEYIVREWLVYKIYNLITPKSFRVRLVSVELNDTKKKKLLPHFMQSCWKMNDKWQKETSTF